MKRHTAGVATAIVGCLVLAACGGGSSNPNSPSGGSSNGTCSTVSVLGAGKGTMNATINGAGFTGGVPTGESLYTAIAAVPALGLPAQDFFIITGICGDNTSIQLTARAVTGTTTIGVDGSGKALTDPLTKQPLVHQGLLQLRQNGVAAGTWLTGSLGGTGTITVATVSTSAATGSFALTMVPQSGTPASGNRTVNGSFSVTF